MSQLGWIDFSPDDRNKVRNGLAMLSEPGTLDELGVGQIRDAYSDLLFPGISPSGAERQKAASSFWAR